MLNLVSFVCYVQLRISQISDAFFVSLKEIEETYKIHPNNCSKHLVFLILRKRGQKEGGNR